MGLTIDQIIADNARMERFICERTPPDGARIDVGGGSGCVRRWQPCS